MAVGMHQYNSPWNFGETVSDAIQRERDRNLKKELETKRIGLQEEGLELRKDAYNTMKEIADSQSELNKIRLENKRIEKEYEDKVRAQELYYNTKEGKRELAGFGDNFNRWTAAFSPSKVFKRFTLDSDDAKLAATRSVPQPQYKEFDYTGKQITPGLFNLINTTQYSNPDNLRVDDVLNLYPNLEGGQ